MVSKDSLQVWQVRSSTANGDARRAYRYTLVAIKAMVIRELECLDVNKLNTRL